MWTAFRDILGGFFKQFLRREFFFSALLNISPKKKSMNLTPVGFQISLKLTPPDLKMDQILHP